MAEISEPGVSLTLGLGFEDRENSNREGRGHFSYFTGEKVGK